MVTMILATAAGEIGLGAGGATVLGLAVLLVKRGLHAKIDVGNGDSEGKGPRPLCPLHAEFAARLDERHEAIKESLGDIKSAVGRVHEDIVSLHERMDEVLRQD
jgi:hypothetical protein